MVRKLILTALMLALVSPILLVTGCASTASTPSALTGNVTPEDRAQFTDNKGHYHPEWAMGINRPAGL
jgi:hypothetical protein